MNVYDNVVRASKTLMFQEPFYGLFLISLNKELNEKIPTACVSKNNINFTLSINSKFWEDLDEKSRIGVLKHELLHIVFFHLNMQDQFSNKQLLNIAADLEVNQYIDNNLKGEKWTGLCINNAPFKDLNLLPRQGTKYYYDNLQNEMNNNPESELSQMLGDMMGEGDIHELWKEFENLSEAEKKLMSKQVDHTLKEIAKELTKNGNRAGNIPGEMKEYIDNLLKEKEPVMDWKSYLRRFSGISNKVTTKKTRYKENRRFNENPALRIHPKRKTLVAIDTSGSVSDKDLVEFFNEINHIYKTGIEVTIVECDTQIQRVYEYKGKKDKIEVQGRGGTDFNEVIEYLIENRNKYNNLIYLTDGEASVPNKVPLKPILWVHCSSCRINEDLPGAKIQITKN
jgi:predicted metal-dependent peptidase